MKKKFLIPIVGLFALALAINFTQSNDSKEYSGLFVDSDNIAFAEGTRNCGYLKEHYCIIGNTSTYDEEYCG